MTTSLSTQNPTLKTEHSHFADADELIIERIKATIFSSAENEHTTPTRIINECLLNQPENIVLRTGKYDSLFCAISRIRLKNIQVISIA
jgi:hypothetical protein